MARRAGRRKLVEHLDRVFEGAPDRLEACPTDDRLEACPTDDRLEACPTDDRLKPVLQAEGVLGEGVGHFVERDGVGRGVRPAVRDEIGRAHV